MFITINGKSCAADYGEYILNIALRNNIEIPTLCHSDVFPGQASCRLCVVEIIDNTQRKVVTSCVYPVTKEIEVVTDSPKIISLRKTIIMLLLARAPHNQYLNRLKDRYEAAADSRFASNTSEDCVLCGLCVRACTEMGRSAISTVNRGITKKVSTPYDEPAQDCIGCTTCAQVCPTGAIKVHEQDRERSIWNKRFDLLACTNCQEHYITRQAYNYINTKLGDTTEQLCSKCKKTLIPKKFKDIYAPY